MKKSSLKTESKRALALLLALLFCVLVSGCRRGKDPKADPFETAAPSPSPEATEAPSQGGTLRLPIPVNAPYEDPLLVNTEEMLYLFSLVYDSLLTVDPSGEIQPCLCESWVGEGDGAWLLKLREGVKWHDGSGVIRSQEVLDTYNALILMEDSYYKHCLDHIVFMQAADTFSVRVKFDIPGIMGLYSLVFPIRKAGAPLIGTGAYRLEHRDDSRIKLTVNTEWWDKLPYVEKVVFEERDSNSTALASYEAGQLNFVPTDILTAGRYSEAGVTSVYDVMTQNMEVLLFNHVGSVFKDLDLRLAAAHGINRSRIITNVYSNRARAADVPIPPDSWLYDSRSAVLNYDPDLSLRLIEEAGFTVQSKEGLRYSKDGRHLWIRLLTSATTENTVRSDAAAMIASQLEQLGFKVEITTAPHTLGDAESEFLTALKAGNWDIALVGFNLGLNFDVTSYIDVNGANNFGNVCDWDLIEKAMYMAAAQTEEDLRDAAYDFQSYFVSTVPFMPLYFRLNSIICSSEIKGIEGAREPFLFFGEKNWHIEK
ncbi:MAG: hypothetical protein K6G56_02890 [Clostridiales bacterium]|nr:hypothetical protein [Clostridiales bacterium]